MVDGSAREIPGQFTLRVRRHVRPGSEGDEVLACAIHILEEEASILTSVLVREVVQDIRTTWNPRGGGMLILGEVVCLAMKDHIA